MNQEYEKQYVNESSVNLGEVCWKLLEGWKALLLVALIVGLALAGLMAMRTGRSQKAAEGSGRQTAQEMTAQEILAGLPKDQRGLVSNAFQIKQKNDRLNEYIDTAPMMEVNPYNAHEIKTSWAVTSAEGQERVLVQAYVDLLQSNEVCDKLRKAVGVSGEVKQFRELMNFIYPEEDGPGFFTCTIALTAKMDPEILQKELFEQVEDIYRDLNGRIGKHEIAKISSGEVYLYDSTLAVRQGNIYTSLYTGFNQLNRLQEEFSTEQKTAYRQLTAEKEEGAGKKGEEKAAKKSAFNPVFFIIGLILGAILYAAVLVLWMLLNGRVHDATAMQHAGIRSFGEWYDPSGARGGLAHDRGAYKKHHQGHLDREFELNRIADSIESACGFRQVSNLLLIAGAVLTDGQQAFVNDLKEKLAAAGITVADAIVCSKEDATVSDRDLAQCGAAALVLAGGATNGRDVDAVIEKCNYYEKPMLGSVYLG
ncbi:MAG: hypothetical protein II787_02855 [Lachnospiraceae bacterium]|nr:hypothetical protein [Lachnospiraceae bacterium]